MRSFSIEVLQEGKPRYLYGEHRARVRCPILGTTRSFTVSCETCQRASGINTITDRLKPNKFNRATFTKEVGEDLTCEAPPNLRVYREGHMISPPTGQKVGKDTKIKDCDAWLPL